MQKMILCNELERILAEVRGHNVICTFVGFFQRCCIGIYQVTFQGTEMILSVTLCLQGEWSRAVDVADNLKKKVFNVW